MIFGGFEYKLFISLIQRFCKMGGLLQLNSRKNKYDTNDENVQHYKIQKKVNTLSNLNLIHILNHLTNHLIIDFLFGINENTHYYLTNKFNLASINGNNILQCSGTIYRIMSPQIISRHF